MLAADFEVHGEETMKILRTTESGYPQIVASLMPKALEVTLQRRRLCCLRALA